MSRIGKKPIQIPEKVKVSLDGNTVTVVGPGGTLTRLVTDKVKISVAGSVVNIERVDDDPSSRSQHGLFRALIQNMVDGVTKGFTREMDIIGVGFRAEVKGSDLHLTLGFSHPVVFPLPKGISAKVDKMTHLIISGADKELVGEVAAKIRKLRAPEPYKGKGIKYTDEVILRKAGKTAGAGK